MNGVLESIALDASIFGDSRDIDDFIGNVGGLEAFSGVKGALKAYRDCQRIHDRFHKMFTESEIQQLDYELREEPYSWSIGKNGNLFITRNYPCALESTDDDREGGFNRLFVHTFRHWNGVWSYWDDNNDMLRETGISVGMTAAPVIVWAPDDSGPKSRCARIWGFVEYETREVVQTLRERGEVVFTKGHDGRQETLDGFVADAEIDENREMVKVRLMEPSKDRKVILDAAFPLELFGPTTRTAMDHLSSAYDFIDWCEGADGGAPMVHWLLAAALSHKSYPRTVEIDGDICRAKLRPRRQDVWEAFEKAGYTAAELEALWDCAVREGAV